MAPRRVGGSPAPTSSTVAPGSGPSAFTTAPEIETSASAESTGAGAKSSAARRMSPAPLRTAIDIVPLDLLGKQSGDSFLESPDLDPTPLLGPARSRAGRNRSGRCARAGRAHRARAAARLRADDVQEPLARRGSREVRCVRRGAVG